MPTSIDERRLHPRLEPSTTRYVDTARGDGVEGRAEVLDWSLQGMRLLFRPAIDLDRGALIALSDPGGEQREPALVQWCHHKRHFTVAGVRACRAAFGLTVDQQP